MEDLSNPKMRSALKIVVGIIIFASIFGVLFMGERQKTVSEQESSKSVEIDPREKALEIASYMQAFANSIPSPTWDKELLSFHEVLTMKKPFAILIWPSSCSACTEYKNSVWDKVASFFSNVSFIDYRFEDRNGTIISSTFGIDGITIVLGYNGRIMGVSYGEHVPLELFYEYLRVLTKSSLGELNG